MDYRIEVYWQADVPDGRVADLLAQIAQLGLGNIRSAQVSDLYFLRGELAHADLERLAQELLADPVVEGYQAQDLPSLDIQGDLVHRTDIVVILGKIFDMNHVALLLLK